MDVEKPFEAHPEYEDAVSRSALVQALVGGTRVMHAGAETWLPAFAIEENYPDRLAQARLWSGYYKALKFHADRVFENPITTRAGAVLPGQWEAWERDIDGKGSSLNQWAYKLFVAGEHFGIVHVLADGSSEALPAGQGRGFLNMITPRHLVNWSPGEDGELEEIRIAEAGPNGEERRRIIRADEWVVYERARGAAVRKVSEGPWGLGYIPLSTWTATTNLFDDADEFVVTPFMQAEAEINLEHYQSSSVQRNGLAMARRPWYLMFGFDDKYSPSALGGSVLIKTQAKPEDVSVATLEHDTAPLELGYKDIDRLQEELALLVGQSILNERPGTQSATKAALDSAEASCGVQRLANDCGETINSALFDMGQWSGVNLLDPAEVNQDVGINLDDDLDIVWRLATEFGTAPERMRQLLVDEYMRRGKLGRSTDTDALLAEAAKMQKEEADGGAEVADMLAEARELVEREGSASGALDSLEI